MQKEKTKTVAKNVGATSSRPHFEGIAKNKKGITLVALVITIIVMLILVGVSVTVALNGGLFITAKEAAEGTISKRNEELNLSDGKVQINGQWYNSTEEYLEESKGHGNSSTSMLEGEGQTYYALAPTALSFRSSADIGDFQEVQVNGETIDQSNYTITEGSTIITLSTDYLKNLEEGDYSISIVSKTGSPSTGFSVIKPDANNHGFYYNQPYTAYLPSFGGNTAFFIREDGTYDIITVGKSPDTGEYTVSGNNISATHPLLGTITCTISPDGTEIYCNELATNFVLGDESFSADEDFFYTYDSSLGGYVVAPINKTKASYNSIRTDIYGKPTVALEKDAFRNNSNLTVAPIIPDSVTSTGEHAFRGCTNLNSVSLPGSITEIGLSAFEGCTSLKSITIPSSVTRIENSAFSRMYFFD